MAASRVQGTDMRRMQIDAKWLPKEEKGEERAMERNTGPYVWLWKDKGAARRRRGSPQAWGAKYGRK